MAEESINGALNSQLADFLMGEDIQPGSEAGYKMCKIIWEYHPLGGKMVEKPIEMAMFKPRIYNVSDDAEDRIVNAFIDTWVRLGITQKIKNLFFNARCYGAAAIGIGQDSVSSYKQITKMGLKEEDIFINIFDPLVAAGSMVTSQDPNTRDFQQPDKYLNIQGKKWHPSRTMKVFTGSQIYLSYQSSSMGFTGRSVFQRCLYPLRSYVNTMITNDLVSEKAGVLVAKTTQNSSVISGVLGMANKAKRGMIKAVKNKGVMNIGAGDSIESLNLQNIDGAMNSARSNIIADIAAGSDVPAAILKDEAFANGFGEGKEDSKSVAQYIDSVRQSIDPVITFFEEIVQYIAWNEDFYNSLKNEYPDIYTDDYYTTFFSWRASFEAKWPELQEESPEGRQDSESKLLEQTTKILETLYPRIDPENQAAVAQWLSDVINMMESYEGAPLVLDMDSLKSYRPPMLPTEDDAEYGNAKKGNEEEA
ncbi:anti-CBASS protein Acb1 family protein [Serratia quinivorans]|nr:anti-CBASS Acb1 family protein [Serratia quinivorans]